MVLVPAAKVKSPAEVLAKKEKSSELVEKERIIVIDVLIIQTMKARKNIQHNELVADVIQRSNTFQAQPLQIKKRIEHLIGCDYIKRDENDRNNYIYLP